MNQTNYSGHLDRLVTDLANAVLAIDDRPTLTVLRSLVLDGKPLAELFDEDLGTDLLCLVDLKLDQPPPSNQIQYYVRQIEKDLKRRWKPEADEGEG